MPRNSNLSNEGLILDPLYTLSIFSDSPSDEMGNAVSGLENVPSWKIFSEFSYFICKI